MASIEPTAGFCYGGQYLQERKIYSLKIAGVTISEQADTRLSKPSGSRDAIGIVSNVKAEFLKIRNLFTPNGNINNAW